MFTKYAITTIKDALIPADKTLYMGLIENAPNDFGENVQEVDYNNYERQAVVFDTVIDHHPTGNTNHFTFPVMAKGSNGINVGYFGLWDAKENGQLIEIGQFTDNGQPTVETLSPNRTITLGVNSVRFGVFSAKPCQPTDCGCC